MQTDTENKQKEEIENLGQLVDRYAQSRSLGLWIPLLGIVLNAVLLVGAIELVGLSCKYGQNVGRLMLVVLILVMVWVVFSSLWLQFKILKRYGQSFYKKEGQIELEREKVPIWAWGTYGITFLGPAILTSCDVMPVRWALVMALTSFGTFMLYVGKKHREKTLGIVYGTLCLFTAAGTATGAPIPFAKAAWEHTYFVALIIYIVGAGLITLVVVHIYNRVMLRKIEEMRPFGEQAASKSDT